LDDAALVLPDESDDAALVLPDEVDDAALVLPDEHDEPDDTAPLLPAEPDEVDDAALVLPDDVDGVGPSSPGGDPGVRLVTPLPEVAEELSSARDRARRRRRSPLADALQRELP
jgi:hypothetical protein